MWQLVAGFNLVIATCYLLISSLILSGLVRSRQLGSNALALATAAIFLTCAAHHLEHGLHVWDLAAGSDGEPHLREMFVSWHQVLIEAAGATAAVVYLALRRSYTTLLNTPAMFEDAVRAEAAERLRTLAYTDVLTGVPNRAAFQELATGLPVDDTPVSVLFVDLDGFKTVNDLLGHDAGDALLRDVAQRILGDLRDGEHLFRTGGDEFVVVALGADAAGADAVTERLHRLMGEASTAAAGQTTVTASIGRASGTSRVGLDHLLREADAAMYRIKAGRRGDDVGQATAPQP